MTPGGRWMAAAGAAAGLWAALALGPGEAEAIANFHKVNQHIYRGAQPTAEGFQSLAAMGVRTVVDLRTGQSRSDAEAREVKSAGMRYVSVPLRDLSAPTDEQVARVLAVLDDASAWPVMVHCRRGADRTGTVIACYRVAHDGWTNQKALEEAREHGMSWIERGMRSYILRYRPAGTPPVPASR